MKVICNESGKHECCKSCDHAYLHNASKDGPCTEEGQCRPRAWDLFKVRCIKPSMAVRKTVSTIAELKFAIGPANYQCKIIPPIEVILHRTKDNSLEYFEIKPVENS
ncbi:MAG TPA: hypothetical protein VMX17_03875 [Candidatus Glassbacteria bacterium]|nr:hypothetical protein [Candidatus Glassbacteria bacterium]